MEMSLLKAVDRRLRKSDILGFLEERLVKLI